MHPTGFTNGVLGVWTQVCFAPALITFSECTPRFGVEGPTQKLETLVEILAVWFLSWLHNLKFSCLGQSRMEKPKLSQNSFIYSNGPVIIMSLFTKH